MANMDCYTTKAITDSIVDVPRHPAPSKFLGTAIQLSKDRDTSFGFHLQDGLLEARGIRNSFFRKAEQCCYAVALMSDVAKSVKRSTNATIAQSPEGCIHIKHSDPGSEKKSGRWLYTDAKSSIEDIGPRHMFINIFLIHIWP